MNADYSVQRMVSDGTLSSITLGIQYLQRNDIYMRIAGEETPQSGAMGGYTWGFIDDTRLQVQPVVPAGIEVVVYRRTDVDAMYNVYSQNAQFDESTIDENYTQLLYITQEYLEQGATIGVDDIEYVRDDGYYTYYRIKRTDGSYGREFKVPSAGTAAKVLAREALRRTYAEAGLTLVAGSFEVGGTLTRASDVLLQESSGKAYGWAGAFPKVVAAGSAVTGFVDKSGAIKQRIVTTVAEIQSGIFKAGDLLEVSDRGNAKFNVIAGTANGFDKIQAGAGAVAALAEKSAYAEFFGADASGVTDSTPSVTRAIEYINTTPAFKGKQLLFGAGRFKLTDQLNLPMGGLCGEGKLATILDFSTATSRGAVVYGNGVSWDYRGSLSGFTVIGNLSVSDQAGITILRAGTSSRLVDIRVLDVNIGINISDTYYTSFTDIDLFGQYKGNPLKGYGIFMNRPVNNLVFTNVSVQYFDVAVSAYNPIEITETSNNILFNKCSFEAIGSTCFIFRRVYGVMFNACYTERLRRNTALTSPVAQLLVGEIGSSVTFESSRMTMEPIAGDVAFDGDCVVTVRGGILTGFSVVGLVKAGSASTVFFDGIKNTDLASAYDFSQASYAKSNQYSGGSEFLSSHILQTSARLKTGGIAQTTGGSEVEVCSVKYVRRSIDTATVFSLRLTRAGQYGVIRTANITVTIGISADGAVTLSEEVQKANEYYSNLLFPATGIFSHTTTDSGADKVIKLNLKPFSSTSGDVTSWMSMISGSVDLFILTAGVHPSRTNMVVTINNK